MRQGGFKGGFTRPIIGAAIHSESAERRIAAEAVRPLVLRGRAPAQTPKKTPSPADPDAILMRGAAFPPRTLTRFGGLIRASAPLAGRTGTAMLDLVLLTAGLAFFGLAAGYTALCARL